MKVKREEVKMVLIMFIFAVCRRMGSALCSVLLVCGHFPELAYLREDRASNHQLLWCKCQVGGAGEVERLLTSEAGRDINLGPLQSIH